jgi:hypothetical protein
MYAGFMQGGYRLAGHTNPGLTRLFGTRRVCAGEMLLFAQQLVEANKRKVMVE